MVTNNSLKKSHRVSRNGNEITIHYMDHPACVTSFLRCMSRGIKENIKHFEIKWDGSLVYPDPCVPIAGIIEYYKEKLSISFSFSIPTGSYLEHCHFSEPFVKSALELKNEFNPFDKLFRYDDPAQVAELTQSYINSISRQVECSEGVITALIWCLNEIMDNVLVHSEAGYGFVMAQYHQGNNTIAICVYDSGIGIYNSLQNSRHRPHNAVDAISLVLQEGIGDGKGQGNGLFGLYQIVADNAGALTITSGSGSVMLTAKGEMKKFEKLPYLSVNDSSTTVDFRLNLSKSIDIHKAFTSIGGFDGFDIRIDEMTQEDDTILYDVYSNSLGTATREAGAFLRNDIINTIVRTKSTIILDFAGVKTVSSSFVDELLAKLIMKLGVIGFNKMVRLINMNDNVRFLSERSIYMRIHDEWNNKKD